MRLFLAINLEPRIRRAVRDATTALRDVAPTLSWVDEARLHLTLKFLGECRDAVVPALNAALDDVSRRHRVFPMRLREIGAFPNFRRARVVWLGVEREPRLELLHHDVELACEREGFEIEGRPFRPHLTLARVKPRAGMDELRRLGRAARALAFEDETLVDTIDLMQSTPDGTGARYQRLHAASLRAG